MRYYFILQLIWTIYCLFIYAWKFYICFRACHRILFKCYCLRQWGICGTCIEFIFHDFVGGFFIYFLLFNYFLSALPIQCYSFLFVSVSLMLIIIFFDGFQYPFFINISDLFINSRIHMLQSFISVILYIQLFKTFIEFIYLILSKILTYLFHFQLIKTNINEQIYSALKIICQIEEQINCQSVHIKINKKKQKIQQLKKILSLSQELKQPKIVCLVITFNYLDYKLIIYPLLPILDIKQNQSQKYLNIIKLKQKMPQPRQSLLQYQQAIQVSSPQSLSGSRPKNSNQLIGSKIAIDQLLNSMFPPIGWETDGKNYKRIISTNPPSREDVNTLQKMLDQKLVYRQARDSGICPIREQLHRQCFDEIIRQVTIDSPERGILLMRVRDQLYMTIQSYQTLYQSSLTFSMRKQLQSQQGTPQLQSQIRELQQKKSVLEQKSEELKKKKQTLEKQIKQHKMGEDKKRSQEIQFLKYQASHLQNFLRSANEANK